MFEHVNQNKTNFQAMLAVLFAAFLFSAMFALPKGAATDLQWFQIVFIRYTGGLIFLLPTVWRWHYKGNSLKSSFGLLHIGRSIAGIGSVACVVIAASQIPLADVITISFSNGAIVLVLAGIILGERVLPRHWASIIITILGASLVASQSTEGGQSSFFSSAALIALLAACCMAVEIIVIKFVSEREAIPVTLLYVNGLASLLLLTPSLIWGQWQGLDSWWPVLLMGPIAILGQALNLFAFRKADVVLLTPLTYSSILFSALLGFLLFGEHLSWYTALGAIIIVTGCLIGMGIYRKRLSQSS
ncbi:DMT family transporter [Kiloniella majae]|uniref:DMT family transporter n=1 Tax=Kiloniella majae TaxID=1938558 RepID=UPI000A278404|nr:DMT family transporter [Kiloniella majae]